MESNTNELQNEARQFIENVKAAVGDQEALPEGLGEILDHLLRNKLGIIVSKAGLLKLYSEREEDISEINEYKVKFLNEYQAAMEIFQSLWELIPQKVLDESNLTNLPKELHDQVDYEVELLKGFSNKSAIIKCAEEIESKLKTIIARYKTEALVALSVGDISNIYGDMLTEYPNFAPYIEEFVGSHNDREAIIKTYKSKGEIGFATMGHFVRTPLANFTSKLDTYLSYKDTKPDKVTTKRAEALFYAKQMVTFLDRIPEEVWDEFKKQRNMSEDELNLMLKKLTGILNNLSRISGRELEEITSEVISTFKIQDLNQLLVEMLDFSGMFTGQANAEIQNRLLKAQQEDLEKTS